MAVCLIGLGANLGDRSRALEQAIAGLAEHPQLRVLAVSSPYPTRPIGGPPGQPPFLNAAATLETSLEPQSVLALLGQIETRLGRRRLKRREKRWEKRWGPRTIDLDLLLYDQVVQDGPRLVLPHPRMAWRRFVLEPAAEVAPDMLHPTTGWTIARLLDHLNTALPYVALAGPIGVGKTHLAGELAERAGGAERITEHVDVGRLERFYADPSGNAWEMEIQFLRQRARLLAADQPRWSRQRLVVSDFWFDQSLAFAGVWLAPERREAFERFWQEAGRDVVPPKLTVLLDAPLDQLLDRIRRRGRPCEMGLGPEVLERIRQAILARAGQPGRGPVLRLTYDEPRPALDEVLAAIDAMK